MEFILKIVCCFLHCSGELVLPGRTQKHEVVGNKILNEDKERKRLRKKHEDDALPA
jgi:hypothetical protein